MSVPVSSRAFVVRHGDQAVSDVEELDIGELGPGDVRIRVEWSSVNYKDALAASPTGRVARIDPLVPGIDLAGYVVDAGGSDLRVGQTVLAHGYDLGVAHHGGYSDYATVPSAWVVALPEAMSTREAMSLGTAGFTAALSIVALERDGLSPGSGPVLVTGSSGGVGSVAVDILARRGYEVHASTGKASGTAWLTHLGAARVLTREETSSADKPLGPERWAGAVDCVGGDTLAYVLSTLRYGAGVAASGNTGGVKVATTVFPFILRSARLIGIDSVHCPIEDRRAVWQRLADDLRPAHLDELATSEVDLDGVSDALTQILTGSVIGRTLVRLG